MKKIFKKSKSKDKLIKTEINKVIMFKKNIINKVIYKLKEEEMIITQENYNKAKLAYEKYCKAQI